MLRILLFLEHITFNNSVTLNSSCFYNAEKRFSKVNVGSIYWFYNSDILCSSSIDLFITIYFVIGSIFNSL